MSVLRRGTEQTALLQPAKVVLAGQDEAREDSDAFFMCRCCFRDGVEISGAGSEGLIASFRLLQTWQVWRVGRPGQKVLVRSDGGRLLSSGDELRQRLEVPREDLVSSYRRLAP